MKEEIEINGVKYPLRWTLLSQQLIEGVDMNSIGNIARVAVIATAAIRGANWQSTMTADKLLNEIGQDVELLKQLDAKCTALLMDFVAFNSKSDNNQGNAPAPTKGAND